ncbi:saxitoxin and tetrodotoxin-binding protein 1-like [Stegastes partitus]|uniref:Saxitoxin and tetrodotoxin-binding protein 1-like n=1 Tax=Stegastes partitus TaxID=144197 RepID=A0A9Y4KIG2_9TELE|nr:PREDICTED: saxitoxin and tetrodotoxin-binding protein 1-like [Stegastes partitus]
MTIPDPEKSNHTLELTEPGTKELDGILSAYDDQGRADIYQSCPDCLLCIYSGVFEGTPGRMLLFYRKEGKHQDADDLKAAAIVHKKMAECLKFDVSTWFTYNGTAEFCADKKKEDKEA